MRRSTACAIALCASSLSDQSAISAHAVCSRQKTILITGAAGFIGTNVVRACIEAGYCVVALDWYPEHYTFEPNIAHKITWITGDYGDTHLVKQLLKNNPVDIIIHLGAFIEVGRSVHDPLPFYENNLAKSIVLLKTALESGITKIVFASSAAVYGTPDQSILTEDCPVAPINPYGHTKYMFEQVLHDAEKAYGIVAVILRFFNVGGAVGVNGINVTRSAPTHLIPRVLGAAMTRTPLIVNGTDFPTPDGTCVRDYVHVADVAQAIVDAITYLKKSNPEPITCNIASGIGHSVLEVLECAQEVIKNDDKKILAILGDRRSGDPAQLIASIKNARQKLGWNPRQSNLSTIIGSAYYALTHTAITPTLTEPNSTQNKELS